MRFRRLFIFLSDINFNSIDRARCEIGTSISSGIKILLSIVYIAFIVGENMRRPRGGARIYVLFSLFTVVKSVFNEERRWLFVFVCTY
eukprot:CCRYP_017040-RA/>CCRYP_017040-RA protein AED:0.00 eAED:0.00 QI:18/1/1/1/0/0/2/309/87